VPDDLEGIYDAIKDNALLSKFAGGLGNDWTPVRGMGAHIKGTNGKSQGVVPFLKVANDTLVAVNQGGRRRGSGCAYLETWHIDIEEFLELRKNTGDERRRTHDMNTSNWIPDVFLERVHENEQWTLFSPNEVPDLHELYGKEFKRVYEQYEVAAQQGQMTIWKQVNAVELWRKMLTMLFETAHPWICFKDPCNLRSPQQHVGVVHSSNLCTEVTLNTKAGEEVAVCNLGSVNLPAHIEAGKLDTEKLHRTIHTAMRMLDNVIDINYYSVPEAKTANFRHRPIGLGVMGFQDALYKLQLPYASQEAIEFADYAQETISYYAISASVDLAAERGPYSTFEGSLWSQGILPIDTIQKLAEVRGKYLEMSTTSTLDWASLRERVKQVGIRNSNTMAIAPTATISNVCGVTQSIEPTYQNLYVKSNLSGEFTIINPYLVRDLKALKLWDEVMLNDLKYGDGRLAEIERIPDELKQLYATAFEIDPLWLVEAASRRQKWIDQSQSLNLYILEPSGRQLDNLYKLAWLRGLKTTYYLRSLGATRVQKSTIVNTPINAVDTPPACALDDEECEACQ
jgi:ribonucleoside-diphosphate reductase alpha chain